MHKIVFLYKFLFVLTAKNAERPPIPKAGEYIWVDTKEGGYWRRRRGSVKKAKLNRALKESSSFMKQSAPAATLIIKKLRPYMRELMSGRLHARISGKLRSNLQSTGRLSLKCLNGLDFQPEYPFSGLLGVDIDIEQTRHELTVTIPITTFTIERLNTLITNYYFELILLYGDVSVENGLRTESTDSAVYVIKTDYKNDCRLSIVLPERPWIALLKINTIEGNEAAASPKYYGLKVIAGGS